MPDFLAEMPLRSLLFWILVLPAGWLLVAFIGLAPELWNKIRNKKP